MKYFSLHYIFVHFTGTGTIDGPCEPLYEYMNSSQCTAGTGRAATLLFTSLLSTLIDADLRLGDPDDYPQDATPHHLEEYDFIVIGAGSAGSVVASRLSEVENWKVLLLEAGGNPTASSDIPVLLNSLRVTDIDWQYVTHPDNASCLGLRSSECLWPRGKVLGGSSTKNAMLYVRGNRRDYDNWEELGNTGWNYKKVLNYFKKSEGNRDDEYVKKSSDGIRYHSSKGYQSVELSRRYSLEKQFLTL